jgi:hypothetical protein
MSLSVPRCKFCGERFRSGQEAICLRMGGHGVSEKSGRTFFDPVPYDDNDEHKWFHMSCWLEHFDMSEAEETKEDLFTCVFCPEDLEGESFFYEIELNLFDKDRDGLFSIPKKDLETGLVPRCYACKECIFDGIGEGNSTKACEILALEEDEDDLGRQVEESAQFDSDLSAAQKIKNKTRKIDIGPPPRRRAVG